MFFSSHLGLVSSAVKHGFVHEIFLLEWGKLGKIDVSEKIDFSEVFFKILNFSFYRMGLLFTQQLPFNCDKRIAFARHTETLLIAAKAKPTFGDFFLFNCIEIANKESSLLME
jgi:hypothetical protein